MNHHLGYEKHDLTGNNSGNRRNGKSKKTLKTNDGEIEVVTTRDISITIKELYGVDVSPTLMSQVTEAVEENVRQGQSRPLDSLYPLIWLDGIVIKVYQDKHVIKKNRARCIAHS